ncbi:hypothetical protein G7070_06950 [Propioniciclava coleopterorum]|uniref:Uncharacterized protein n=1 Tax=Propioniciclava coleopterorum TaxID=2714937 RepID=A0A6G7Y5F3_9ACTN|nr:hypothetical protein [Propioniciclava coleopterorum]QIK72052.1 hypothetical protein G7070_06950 [Propioniciclava coleopterorum]
MRVRSILLAAATALATAAIPVASASTADAAMIAPCRGYLISSVPWFGLIHEGGDRGELRVYYDPATGNNCAAMQHLNSTYGKRMYTSVSLTICRESRPGTCTPLTTRTDAGNYAYYAGPVTAYGKGRCIQVVGRTSLMGAQGSLSVGVPGGAHCG